ncbi:hypothetical protein [Streptomyces sp. NPDC055099]
MNTNPYLKQKDRMGLGTKVAAAASLALVGGLMAVGCAADDDDSRCDTYSNVAVSVPAPRPAPPAPRPAPAPAPKPNLNKPTAPKPKSPGGTSVVPVPNGSTTHVTCYGDRDDD